MNLCVCFCSSVHSDGRPRSQRRDPIVQEMTTKNRDNNQYFQVPRTRTLGPNFKPLSTDELLAQSVLKLEKVKKDRDACVQVEQRLQEVDDSVECTVRPNWSPPPQQRFHNQGRALADAIYSKIRPDDDDQSILDMHVSRIWDDRTPNRSGNISPNPLPTGSSTGTRRRTHNVAGTSECGDNGNVFFFIKRKLFQWC